MDAVVAFNTVAATPWVSFAIFIGAASGSHFISSAQIIFQCLSIFSQNVCGLATACSKIFISFVKNSERRRFGKDSEHKR